MIVFPHMLFASGVKPVWLADFLLGTTSHTLPSGVSVSSPSLGGLVGDSTGRLTYKANNLLTYSNTPSQWVWGSSNGSFTTGQSDPLSGSAATLAVPNNGAVGAYFHAPNVPISNGTNYIISLYVKPAGFNYIQFATDYGGGIVTGSSVFQLTGAGAVSSSSTPSGITSVGNGWYKIWVTGTGISTSSASWFVRPYVNATTQATGDGTSGVLVYASTYSAVTYETTPRAADQVITTSSAYYGPAWDYSLTSVGTPLGLRVWESRVNLFLNSATGATQSVTTSAGTYTLSFYGTGSITLSGSGTGTLTGNGAYPAPLASLTFTATAGTLTLTVSGSVSYVNLEQASYAGPRLLTGSGAVTAAADVAALNGVPLGVLQGGLGTAIIEVSGLPATTSVNQSLISNAAGDHAPLYRVNGTDTINDYQFHATLLTGPVLTTWAGTTRAGVAFDAVSSSVTGNGNSVVSGAGSATVPDAYLGSSNTVNFINGYIRKLALYNQRISDAALRAKTVSGASF